uniref:Uncharacterized protein n=1 Tax=Cucumis sativus TaxID=3659 RepID=A0A0A0KMM9_CUCSA
MTLHRSLSKLYEKLFEKCNVFLALVHIVRHQSLERLLGIDSSLLTLANDSSSKSFKAYEKLSEKCNVFLALVHIVRHQSLERLLGITSGMGTGFIQ